MAAIIRNVVLSILVGLLMIHLFTGNIELIKQFFDPIVSVWGHLIDLLRLYKLLS